MSIHDHALLTNTGVNCYLSVAFGVDPVILPKQCIVGTGINLNSIFSYVSKWLRNKNNFILTLLVLVYSESSLTLLVLVYSESSLTVSTSIQWVQFNSVSTSIQWVQFNSVSTSIQWVQFKCICLHGWHSICIGILA